MIDTSLILERADLREILPAYGIKLERKGNYHMCKCPFHPDNNPSCIVNKTKINCFGCGTKANVFEIVEHFEGVPMHEAVVMLADRYGVPVENDNKSFKKLPTFKFYLNELLMIGIEDMTAIRLYFQENTEGAWTYTKMLAYDARKKLLGFVKTPGYSKIEPDIRQRISDIDRLLDAMSEWEQKTFWKSKRYSECIIKLGKDGKRPKKKGEVS